MGEEEQRADNYNSCQAIASIVLQAEKELLSPDQFYRLYKDASLFLGREKLYFLEPDSSLWDKNKGITAPELLTFFDSLATYLRNTPCIGKIINFYLKKEFCNHKLSSLIVETNGDEEEFFKIEVQIVGEGMVGRVARVKINDQYLAFKTFFDPDFVWQHGGWAETAIGLYLKANRVTKNVADFKFAGRDWAAWEWIDPDANPNSRSGITYEEFAQQKGLTKLNNLNRHNYNLQGIRLDAGGIQKEYLGRRLDNFWRAIFFYLRKVKREGIFSLMIYLKKDNIIYIFKRMINLIYPQIYGYFLLIVITQYH